MYFHFLVIQFKEPRFLASGLHNNSSQVLLKNSLIQYSTVTWVSTIACVDAQQHRQITLFRRNSC